jgi:DNA-binding NarL/FixJ family response regulator
VLEAVTLALGATPGSAPLRAGRIADRTRARHADVHRLLADGCSVRETAAALGLSRNTVRRFACAASQKIYWSTTSRADGPLPRNHRHPSRHRPRLRP